jgi:hypothetical protein
MDKHVQYCMLLDGCACQKYYEGEQGNKTQVVFNLNRREEISIFHRSRPSYKKAFKLTTQHWRKLKKVRFVFLGIDYEDEAYPKAQQEKPATRHYSLRQIPTYPVRKQKSKRYKNTKCSSRTLQRTQGWQDRLHTTLAVKRDIPLSSNSSSYNTTCINLHNIRRQPKSSDFKLQGMPIQSLRHLERAAAHLGYDWYILNTKLQVKDSKVTALNSKTYRVDNKQQFLHKLKPACNTSLFKAHTWKHTRPASS